MGHLGRLRRPGRDLLHHGFRSDRSRRCSSWPSPCSPPSSSAGWTHPGGAVAGGLIVGILQNLAAAYVPEYMSWLGDGFDKVVPYLVLVVVLLVRPVWPVRHEGGQTGLMSRARSVHTSYGQDLTIFRSRSMRSAVLGLIVFGALLPYWLGSDWLQTLSIAGCFAIGSISLNLLTGYTGQVSLGHAFFLAIGGYTVGHIGKDAAVGVIGWLLLVAVIGALVGAAIGPFALRLRGSYLAIITIGLLYVSDYLWNRWTWFTGGGRR